MQILCIIPLINFTQGAFDVTMLQWFVLLDGYDIVFLRLNSIKFTNLRMRHKQRFNCCFVAVKSPVSSIGSLFRRSNHYQTTGN